jgi:serine/threonine protein kinase
MGTVYVGEHTLIGRRAAIKVLRPELSQRREIIDRFFNEARAAAAIKHPGIVQIFDFGIAADGSAYLVMELLDGNSLAATLRERGHLPVFDVLRVIRQIATSIARAHAAGVIHRDLKPDNIFLLRDSDVIGGVRVKILDFGVAKLSEAFNASRTEAGGLFGTPLYMAPEMFDGKVDERSDIYSLGCMMYESLVGTPPFQGESLPQLLRSHTSQQPAAPSSLRPALSPALDTIVLRCLEKNPGNRFSSMTELADAIEHTIGLLPRDELASEPSPAPAPDVDDDSELPTLIPGVDADALSGTRLHGRGSPASAIGPPTLFGVGEHAAPAEPPLGRYRLVRRIACGRSADVFLASSRGIQGFEKHVALKRLNADFAADRQCVRRLTDGAMVLAQLSHSNIVQIFELGQVNGTDYVTMEYVDGADLSELLRRAAMQHVNVPLDVCAFIAKELAAALDHAHGKRGHAGELLGIVHRDVSPDHVLVSYAGEVKLIDFGAARTAMNTSQTAVDALEHNVCYMSPEQASGDPVDHRTDIFSAGMVLHELITAQRLYASQSLTDAMELARNAEIPPPSRLRSDVPPQLDRIVMRAVAKPLGERYQSAGELLADLERFLHACVPAFTRTKLSDLLHRVVGPPQPVPAPAWARQLASAEGTSRPPIGPSPEDPEASSRWTFTVFQSPPSLDSAPATTHAQPKDATPRFSPGATMVAEPPVEHRPPSPPPEVALAANITAPARTPRTDTRRTDQTECRAPLPWPGPSARGRADKPRHVVSEGLAAVLKDAVPQRFRSSVGSLVEFFAEMFATARRIADRVIELRDPAIEDLASRAHYVLFLDDIANTDAGPFGEIDTAVFRASVDPLTVQLEQLKTPPGSVLIVILAAQLGQGARETIFALRKERNLFVVPIAASEIRRECAAGNAGLLLINRIADLHTVSDPFGVQEDFIDPTRCIGFAADVADLVRHITTGGKIVSVAGPPGSGKTSVVAMAEYGCDTHEVSRRFVRLACGELTSFDPDTLIRDLLEQVDRIDARNPGARPHEAVPPTEGTDLTTMRASIMRLAGLGASPDRPAFNAPRTHGGARPGKRDQLVIVLEDADWLIRLASSSESDVGRRLRARELWRSLAKLCSDSGYTVIVTSVRDFQVIDQMPHERPVSVSRVPMRALSRRESDRLVCSLGELVGFSPDREALARLHEQSGGNVYALRLLCSTVIRGMRERPEYMPLARLEVTAALVDAAALRIAATGSTFRPHVSVWLDDVEKTVLQYIASERPQSPRQVRRALDGSADPELITRALDGLELMGLVEFRDGRHRVRIALLERWIETHLEPPARRRNAIREARVSRVAIGCTVAALLVGAYWTVLRSTRSADSASLDDCRFELDHPDRIGVDETFALFVYQHCKVARHQQLTLEPVMSSLHIPAPTSDCTPTTASCTALFQPVAREQAHDAYHVQLLVDGQPLASGEIERDRFASVRSIGERTVPQVAWLLPLLSVLLAFHKDLKRAVLQLTGRGGEPPAAPPAGPDSGRTEPAKP